LLLLVVAVANRHHGVVLGRGALARAAHRFLEVAGDACATRPQKRVAALVIGDG